MLEDCSSRVALPILAMDDLGCTHPVQQPSFHCLHFTNTALARKKPDLQGNACNARQRMQCKATHATMQCIPVFRKLSTPWRDTRSSLRKTAGAGNTHDQPEPTPRHPVITRMYLRFVVPSFGRYAWGLIGIIQAASDLEDAGDFTYRESALFDSICEWFNQQLPVPRRFSRSRRSGADHNAVCWFKPTSVECVRKARELAKLLEGRGVQTAMLRTRKPGYVVYEDRLQVVAEPFHDTFNRPK